MRQGIVIKDKIAILIVVIVFISMIGLMLACAGPTHLQPIPTSPWGDTYAYRYDPPEKRPPASVKATIIVVNPAYREVEESALRERIYLKVGRGFSASMGVDMDKIIVAKGMTSKGPYASLEEITYSDKKVSDLTLAPKVYITTDIKYGKWDVEYGYDQQERRYITRSKRRFDMKIGGWISFAMQEPMSGQKMWVKKLDLDEIPLSGEEYAESKDQYDSRGRWVGYSEKETVYDGKIDAMADALKQMYPIIMQKCWTYIDSDEILSLKDKVKEIRDLKRY